MVCRKHAATNCSKRKGAAYQIGRYGRGRCYWRVRPLQCSYLALQFYQAPFPLLNVCGYGLCVPEQGGICSAAAGIAQQLCNVRMAFLRRHAGDQDPDCLLLICCKHLMHFYALKMHLGVHLQVLEKQFIASAFALLCTPTLFFR